MNVIIASIIFSSVYLISCIVRWFVIFKLVLEIAKDKEKEK